LKKSRLQVVPPLAKTEIDTTEKSATDQSKIDSTLKNLPKVKKEKKNKKQSKKQ